MRGAEQPVDIWQASQQCPCPAVVAGLPSRDKEVDRAAKALTAGVQLRVHAAFGATYQTSASPF